MTKYSNDIHDTLQIIEIEAAMLKLVVNKDNKKAMELAERIRKRAAELKNKNIDRTNLINKTTQK